MLPIFVLSNNLPVSSSKRGGRNAEGDSATRPIFLVMTIIADLRSRTQLSTKTAGNGFIMRLPSERSRILLHHDHASAHTAQWTTDYLATSGEQILGPPPNSPNLAPCHFYLFLKINKKTYERAIRGRRESSGCIWRLDIQPPLQMHKSTWCKNSSKPSPQVRWWGWTILSPVGSRLLGTIQYCTNVGRR